MGRNSLSAEDFNRISADIINASKKLIASSGIDNLTARTIAQEANVNVAIIYRHFRDIDELKIFACLDLFQEYIVELASAATAHKPGSATTTYMLCWKLFCKHCFEHPRSAFTIFFGKHTRSLATQIERYYMLFPEKRISMPIYNRMLSTENIFDRNMEILRPVLVGRKNEKEIAQINEITILYFKGLLESEIQDSNLKKETLSTKMLNVCRLLIS